MSVVFIQVEDCESNLFFNTYQIIFSCCQISFENETTNVSRLFSKIRHLFCNYKIKKEKRKRRFWETNEIISFWKNSQFSTWKGTFSVFTRSVITLLSYFDFNYEQACYVRRRSHKSRTRYRTEEKYIFSSLTNYFVFST